MMTVMVFNSSKLFLLLMALVAIVTTGAALTVALVPSLAWPATLLLIGVSVTCTLAGLGLVCEQHRLSPSGMMPFLRPAVESVSLDQDAAVPVKPVDVSE